MKALSALHDRRGNLILTVRFDGPQPNLFEAEFQPRLHDLITGHAAIGEWAASERRRREFAARQREVNAMRLSLEQRRDAAANDGDFNQLVSLERQLAEQPPAIAEKVLRQAELASLDRRKRIETDIATTANTTLIRTIRSDLERRGTELLNSLTTAADEATLRELASIAAAIEAASNPNAIWPPNSPRPYADVAGRAAAELQRHLDKLLAGSPTPAPPPLTGPPLPGTGNFTPPAPGSAADLALYRDNFGQTPDLHARVAVVTGVEDPMRRANPIELLRQAQPAK